MSEWQDIETAPRDGSQILIGYWEDYGLVGEPILGWIVEVVSFEPTNGWKRRLKSGENYKGKGNWKSTWGDVIARARDTKLPRSSEWFTHWARVPAAPQDGQ